MKGLSISQRMNAVHATGQLHNFVTGARWHGESAHGAFALAAAGMVRTLAVESAIRPRWFLALVAWPLVTALPAFLVAIVTATVLRRLRPSPP